MTTDLFKKDYRQMTAQGVKFTPEDIVRLNALAVKVKLSQTAARDVHLPRLAFLPEERFGRFGMFGRLFDFILSKLSKPLYLREPTIAHELWMERAAQWIDIEDDRNFYFLNGYALSRPAEKLADAFRARRVIREVYRFAAKRLALYTSAQLSAAVDYVLYGADWTVGEHGPAPSTKHQAPSTGDEVASPTIGILTDCRMLKLTISIDDAKQMTASELSEAINRAWDLDGHFDQKRARMKALGEYVRAREEVRARSLKSNEPQPNQGKGR